MLCVGMVIVVMIICILCVYGYCCNDHLYIVCVWLLLGSSFVHCVCMVIVVIIICTLCVYGFFAVCFCVSLLCCNICKVPRANSILSTISSLHYYYYHLYIFLCAQGWSRQSTVYRFKYIQRKREQRPYIVELLL